MQRFLGVSRKGKSAKIVAGKGEKDLAGLPRSDFLGEKVTIQDRKNGQGRGGGTLDFVRHGIISEIDIKTLNLLRTRLRISPTSTE
jgi:hypothetical protein